MLLMSKYSLCCAAVEVGRAPRMAGRWSLREVGVSLLLVMSKLGAPRSGWAVVAAGGRRSLLLLMSKLGAPRSGWAVVATGGRRSLLLLMYGASK